MMYCIVWQTIFILCMLQAVVSVNYANLLFNDSHVKNGGFDYSKDFKLFDDRCGGKRQSPVDIKTLLTKPSDFDPFERSEAYIKNPKEMTLYKGNYNLILRVLYNRDDHAEVYGGPLKEGYILDHISFHWGTNSNFGSEHSINSAKFPMEMQAVHYNRNYHSYQEAMPKPQGIAITSYLFQVSKSGAIGIAMLQKNFKKLLDGDDEVQFEDLFPISLLLPPVHRQYATYEGSLTLPPCNENVIWIVNYKPVLIREHELNEFRKIYAKSSSVLNNFRLPQKLDGREILTAK